MESIVADTSATTPKQSTLGVLVSGATSKLHSLFSSASGIGSSLVPAAGGTSTSLLMSPILWVVVAAVGVFVYFKKFHKGSSRKTVKFRR